MDKKLTIRETAFIEHYLENSGVDYIDIRIEMTDHVATAIEAMDGNDFDENFRLYMLEHKAELIKNNYRFKRLATRRAFMALGKTLLKPWFILLPFVIVYVSFYRSQVVGAETVSDVLSFIFGFAFLAAIAPSAISMFTRREKFSVASKVINVPVLIIYAIHFITAPWHIENYAWVAFICYALFITILLAVVVTAFSLKRKYKLRYNG